MNELQRKFHNWMKEMDERWFDFQVKASHDNRDEYFKHQNCVNYDNEIFRLQQFNNPCKSCRLPLHLTKNFEIYGIGPVCQLCYSMHTIISASRYFSELHDKWRAEQNRVNRSRGGPLTA